MANVKKVMIDQIEGVDIMKDTREYILDILLNNKEIWDSFDDSLWIYK